LRLSNPHRLVLAEGGTYVSIRSKWHCLYQEVDKDGKGVDFSAARDRGIERVILTVPGESWKSRSSLARTPCWSRCPDLPDENKLHVSGENIALSNVGIVKGLLGDYK
jgi:hypothetical protein